MKKTFIITKQNSSLRLDKFLASHFPDYSRAYLQKQIKSGAVLINGQIKKPSYILKEDDKVETEILPTPEISLEPDATIKIKIVYEDDDVMVVDKPAGLTAHPSETQKSETLVNTLLAHYPPLKDIGDDPLRPGLVHRLDKDTSGLMIIAKNNNAFEWLKKQFQERKVEKKYLALVVGKPKESSGEIKTFITRSKSDPTKQRSFLLPSDEGRTGWGVEKTSNTTPSQSPPQLRVRGQMREAISYYKTLKKFKNFTLLEAVPKTGRMHQIRAHLAWLGCPVAGDTKYGPRKAIVPAGLKRQFLHATKLTITLPNGEKRTFTSPLPNKLSAILQTLEKNGKQ